MQELANWWANGRQQAMQDIPEDVEDEDPSMIESSPEGGRSAPPREGADAGAGPDMALVEMEGSGMSLDPAEDSQVVRTSGPASVVPSASSVLPAATPSDELPSASAVLPSATFSDELPSASSVLPSATPSDELPSATPSDELPPDSFSDDEVEVLGSRTALEAMSIEELQARLKETSEKLRRHRHLAMDVYSGFLICALHITILYIYIYM